MPSLKAWQMALEPSNTHELELDGEGLVTLNFSDPVHLKWAQDNAARLRRPFLSPRTKLAASKAVEGATKLPFLASDVINLGIDFAGQFTKEGQWSPESGVGKFRAEHKGSKWLDEGMEAAGLPPFLQPQPGNRSEEMVAALAAGAGGGSAPGAVRAATPGLRLFSRALPRDAATANALRQGTTQGAAIGGAAGLAGNVAGDVTGTTDPATGVHQPNAMTDLMVSLLVGSTLGTAASRVDPLKRALSETGRSVAPHEWLTAARNLDTLQRAGATSATLPDAFPVGSDVRKAGATVLAQNAPNPLKTAMMGRDEDLRGLITRALSDVGESRHGGMHIAGQAQELAENRLQQLRNQRSALYQNAIAQARPLDPTAVQTLATVLRAQARAAGNEVDRDALQAVLGVLYRPGSRRLKTNVQDVVKDLKQLQDRLEFNDYQTGGKKLDAGAVRRVYQAVNEQLRQWAPEYARAEDLYARFSREVLAPLKEGNVGLLAGRNPSPMTPTPTSRLEAATKEATPTDVRHVVRHLQAGSTGPQGEGSVNRDQLRAITETLLRHRTAAGEGDLASKFRGGAAGSDRAEATNTLIRLTTPSGVAERVGDKLDAYDLLRTSPQRDLGPSGNLQDEIASTLLGTVATPGTSIRRAIERAARENRMQELGELLARADHTTLQQLRAAAATDPVLAARLTRAGGFAGGIAAGSDAARRGAPQ